MNRNLTTDGIERCVDPYGMVAEYFNDLLVDSGEDSIPDIPFGARQVLLILDLDSEFHNGGLWQYFSNRADDGGTVFDEVRQLPIALETMGAAEMANLVRQAKTCWLALIEKCNEGMRTGKADSLQQFFEHGQPQIERFDKWFDAIYEKTSATISEYIRTHAGDFCHMVE